MCGPFIYGKKHLNMVKKYEDELNSNGMASEGGGVDGVVGAFQKFLDQRNIYLHASYTYDRHVDFVRYIR